MTPEQEAQLYRILAGPPDLPPADGLIVNLAAAYRHAYHHHYDLCARARDEDLIDAIDASAIVLAAAQRRLFDAIDRRDDL